MRNLKVLRKLMRFAAKAPEKGSEPSDIKAGYCSVTAEKHHICYHIRHTHIEIIDVWHASM